MTDCQSFLELGMGQLAQRCTWRHRRGDIRCERAFWEWRVRGDLELRGGKEQERQIKQVVRDRLFGEK